jgi:(S)-mandelate dehydrogenase
MTSSTRDPEDERAERRHAVLRRSLPTIEHLRRRARRRLPRFGFDAIDGGAGMDQGVLSSAAAFENVELLPRHGLDVTDVSTEVELFGRRYSAPFGVAPMSLSDLAWPGAENHLASSARRGRIPYAAGVGSRLTIEEVAELAEDMLWLQLCPIGGDRAATPALLRRAMSAGIRVLILTIDRPIRTPRPGEIAHRIDVPFRMSHAMAIAALRRPAWLVAYLKQGAAQRANLRADAGRPPSRPPEGTGTCTWTDIARYRDAWPDSLVVKGVLHPEDAERAVALGANGVVVSSDGGQLAGLPPAIDVLPSIIARVSHRATVLVDSDVRSGLDILRALALGARAAFLGRPFLYGVGALGPEGAGYVVELLRQEMIEAMRCVGVRSIEDARRIEHRHSSAWPHPVKLIGSNGTSTSD